MEPRNPQCSHGGRQVVAVDDVHALTVEVVAIVTTAAIATALSADYGKLPLSAGSGTNKQMYKGSQISYEHIKSEVLTLGGYQRGGKDAHDEESKGNHCHGSCKYR